MAKKAQKVTKKDLNPVDLIERIPSQNFDLKPLANFLNSQIEGMEADRTKWSTRRKQYIEIIDNFVNYDVGEPPFEGAANVHIPVIMEKARAIHARFYQAIFALQPPFFAEPQEKLDATRLNNIINLMKWGLSRHLNNYKGIANTIDDGLWNFVTEGWCFKYLRYDRQYRKALVVKEVTGNKKKGPSPKDGELTGEDIPVLLEEKEEWVPVYEGPILENIQNESVLIPGGVDIQKAPCAAIETCYTEHDLNYYSAVQYFDPEVVDKVKKFRDSEISYKDSKSVKDQKGRLQGVDLTNRKATQTNSDGLNSEYPCYVCFCTFDIDADGFDEELVVTYHRESNNVLRWTYLDRITSTLRRPIYKSDFIRRPGRQYALGTCEYLFGLNREVDAIHNQRLDFGTFSNMPFWFYNSGMAMPNQKLTIAPGRGVPVEDVQQILFPTLKSGTAWGFQEESLLYQIISRASSISDVNLGIAPTPGDAVRSQGQMAALLNEGNAQLDVSLRRYQDMLSEIYGDIHQMYTEKLPKSFQHLIVGDDNTPVLGADGLPVFKQFKDSRKEIAGKVHFHIKANSAAGNKVLLRQNRIANKQIIADPISIQLGVVSALNLYEMNKAILEASDEIDLNRFITKPENIQAPLSLSDELNLIRQGLLPDIPLNDDHEAKAQAIKVFMTSQPVQIGMQNGTINPNAPVMAEAAIAKHLQLAQAIASMQAQAQNGVQPSQPQGPQLPQQSTQGPSNDQRAARPQNTGSPGPI